MELRDYLRGVRRFWFVAPVCLLMGIAGAGIYNLSTYLDEAKASVAVLSPLVSGKASGSTEAQVSFDSIIRSDALASRVAARMHESPETVANNLSVSIDSSPGSQSTAITSPLYIVHGKDQGLDRAEKLVDIAIEEATQLYFRINATDGSDLKAAIAAQRVTVTGEVTAAQQAFDDFRTKNNAVDLHNRVQQERDIVTQLTIQTAAARADNRAYPSSLTNGRYQSLLKDLAAEKAELKRLTGLLVTYDRLQFEVDAAKDREQVFDAQEQNLLVNTLLPSQVQVKVLDSASVEDQTLFLLLVYGLGVVSGLILGLAALYVLGLIYRRPASGEEVADAMAAPILVRIPRVAS
jgi:uncharacterized protein involved in exopolysaccharide biosynthesis